MFTGLIQAMGTLRRTEPTATGAAIAIGVPRGTLPGGAWAEGESIAVDGCCLTLARVAAADGGPPGEDELGFDVIPETLRLTRFGGMPSGTRVHLERSATPATLLGGHLVQGHVDGLGRIVAVERSGGEWRVRIAPPPELMRWLASKGSIAVDGVSLTVAAIDDGSATFDVCLIPETLARTALGERRPGDAVHLEADCFAKMIERQLAYQLAQRLGGSVTRPSPEGR